jgi:hypothetical protein
MIALVLLTICSFASLLLATDIEARQALTRQTCTIQPKKDGSDDSPAILEAFEKCGQGGRIVFLRETYNIGKVMKTIGLNDCQIDIPATLKVCLTLNYCGNGTEQAAVE